MRRAVGTLRRILLTGAGGAIGSSLRRGLSGYHRLRLLDSRPLTVQAEREEVVVADLREMAAAEESTRDVDTVVHMAGVREEAAWERILANNIEATFNLFEAARRNRVQRIVFASSNHVIGYYRRVREVDAVMPPRPDSRYAVSKVFGEALGRLYADKHGIGVACLRIGSFRERPENGRQLTTWISPRDLTALVQCCIDAPELHFTVVNGISNNRRRRVRDDARETLGYRPKDDAEDHAEMVTQPLVQGIAGCFHGGEYCAREFSGDIDSID